MARGKLFSVIVFASILTFVDSPDANAWFRRCRRCSEPMVEYKTSGTKGPISIAYPQEFSQLNPVQVPGGGKFFVWGSNLNGYTVESATVEWTGQSAISGYKVKDPDPGSDNWGFYFTLSTSPGINQVTLKVYGKDSQGNPVGPEVRDRFTIVP